MHPLDASLEGGQVIKRERERSSPPSVDSQVDQTPLERRDIADEV